METPWISTMNRTTKRPLKDHITRRPFASVDASLLFYVAPLVPPLVAALDAALDAELQADAMHRLMAVDKRLHIQGTVVRAVGPIAKAPDAIK
jgi:hypothetical protein